jgi:acid phosphatase type 7
MTQPYVFWTLLAPFVTIIGLYSNVPEGGEIHNDQIGWLAAE